jgi:hypothetical protein
MRLHRLLLLTSFMLVSASPALAAACDATVVFEDRDGDGVHDPGEPPMAGVRVSDGRDIAVTGEDGRFQLPAAGDGRTVFAIKPAGFAFAPREDGLPDFWRNLRTAPGPALRYGGFPVSNACADIGLRRERPAAARSEGLRVLVFADPQPKSRVDVGYYERDIVEAVIAGAAADRTHAHRKPADLGLSLGDIVDDDLSLYPEMKRITARLGVPWLHVAGNHDLDFDAGGDEDSLLSFRHHFGPDTFAWEEPEANFVALDDVVYLGKGRPSYIGGLREAQFAFLERYLAGADRQRLLVIAVHIPLFEPEGRDTFRDADRARLFALLRDFPKVLLLSAHSHTQRHVFHDAATGWHGAAPLHEYNVGAACGAFWSGAKDARGIPDATMADGTPNGYARLTIAADGRYRLSWHEADGVPTGSRPDSSIGLHAPRVLRRGAYPAFGVYANVYMGRDDSRVEYRIDGGAWQPMRKILRPDPRLLAQNVRDDEADALRGYDRSPEAELSAHLWRGTLPTDLAAGEHAVEVRAFDAWNGEQRAATRYRLEEATP